MPGPGTAPLRLERTDYAGGVALLTVAGEVNPQTSPDLRRALQDLFLDAREVVVDLHGVARLDSTGLAVLIDAQRHSRNSGSRLSLANLSPVCERLFAVTGMNRIMAIYRTTEDALCGSVPGDAG
jgi:anti-anti-sigma factor